jgi:hypothetical protein
LRILGQHDQGVLRGIWHTDHRAFRLALQEDEKLLDALISRLRGAFAEKPLG